MRRLRWLIAILLAFSLVAAACGDDDDTSTAADTGDDAADAGDDAADAGDDAADAGDDAADAGDDTDADDDAADAGDDAGAEILTDVGVDPENKVIRIGYNTDLTGIFAPLTTKITNGAEAFWENVNATGGLADGWTVEPIVLDNAYDVPTHLENYDVMSGDGPESVVMLAQSTGSPHTAAIAADLVEDGIAAIPLSWYSGWADPTIGQNVFEVQTNYCIEAMNAVTFLSENFGNKMAVVGFPGDYGEDGSLGAKVAAEALGLEIVYDGQAEVIPGADQTPVITSIAESGADFVWLTTNPSTTAELIGGAAAAGFAGQWSGNSPSWNPALLATDLAPILDATYTHSTYTALWGSNDTPGMQAMIAAMTDLRPDAPFDDVYIISWINGLIVSQALEAAIANGDLTRAGVLEAIGSIEVDLQGLAPNQSWSGDPNDNVVRETYLYDIVADTYTPGATVTTPDASTGYELIQGPFSSPTAQAWEYEPCFKAS